MRSIGYAIITVGARPYGQAVKTPPSHGGIRSSILLRVTKQKASFLADSSRKLAFLCGRRDAAANGPGIVKENGRLGSAEKAGLAERITLCQAGQALAGSGFAGLGSGSAGEAGSGLLVLTLFHRHIGAAFLDAFVSRADDAAATD